jgi:hypothetical protein
LAGPGPLRHRELSVHLPEEARRVLKLLVLVVIIDAHPFTLVGEHLVLVTRQERVDTALAHVSAYALARAFLLRDNLQIGILLVQIVLL